MLGPEPHRPRDHGPGRREDVQTRWASRTRPVTAKGTMADDPTLPARESMEYDVVIVGAGPAGLAAAIRLKSLDPDISVVVVEKGSTIGAHILSGAVIDPIGLDRLTPYWRSDPECPLKTQVATDEFYYLTETSGVRLPNWALPRLMGNHGNFIGSLGAIARWLGARAEALGVEIYPGFAATELLYGDKGEVVGIATGDMGVDREGHAKPGFTRGMELFGKYVLLAEGARGSLSKQAVARFGLDSASGPQKYGLGLKELWQVSEDHFSPGLVRHTCGWPLSGGASGGSFLYHYGERLVSVGFVVHLNYENPTLSPFDEFQRFKTHPIIRETFLHAKRIGYGARVIASGGWQSVPKLVFPGGAFVGCSAGFVNFARIKGSHNAILSGILAAETTCQALAEGRANDEPNDYESFTIDSAIGCDLYKVRNVKPLWSRFGLVLGVGLGGLYMWTNELFKSSIFDTLKHGKPDSDTLKPISVVAPIVYPKPDSVLTFDKLSSVYLSNTHHEEDQPIHLRLHDPDIPIRDNLPRFGEPSRLYCPAGVYEVVYTNEADHSNPRFVINAQNCVHCKTCDIKDPAKNIEWTPPEGGGGPNYPDL